MPRRPFAAADFWIAFALVPLLALAWFLADVLLLALFGVLVALVLARLARPLERRWGWPRTVALPVVVVAALALLVAASWAAGAGAAEQLQALRQTIPRALAALRDWLEGRSFGRLLLEAWNGAGLSAEQWERVAGLATGTVNAAVGAVGALVLGVAIGIYLAADPQSYRRGLLALLPPSRRGLFVRALDRAGADLRGWLLGQAVSMAGVALLTGLGLWAIGMPLAFSLAVIAGLLDFVPYFGPVVAGALTVAVALTEGERTALWALGVVVAVQQAEAYLLQPLAQRWAVRLPPVLGLVAVLIFGVLFGLPGVLLAVPLIVLTRALVRVLYVEGVLGAEAGAPAGTPLAAPTRTPEDAPCPPSPTS